MLKEVHKIIPKVFLVGGSVRDEILGRTPKDYDFATPMLPDEIEQAVRDAGKRPYLIGKRFGTIGFKLNGEMVEVTSFRQERYFEGSRKPEVEFVKDITADLSRRDFTINAMAKRVDGSIIDPFGGREDLANKIIRCVGTPKARFKEDPLRILRACRFSSQLDFMIEEKTYEYMCKMRTTLLNVSKERWCIELDKLLVAEKPLNGLIALMAQGIFNIIIPELSLQENFNQESPHHSLDLWNHTLKALISSPCDLHIRWALLLHDTGKPFTKVLNKHKTYYNYLDHEKISAEIVEKTGLYLKRSNEWTNTVKDLVINHMDPESPLKKYDNMGK